MKAPPSSSRRVRTGLFEIDFGSTEVYREGRRVPIQELPFRVLATLLEHPGQIVTREELQSRLWPADTYVGFDEGLNTAIRKLRVALGDSAENPCFLETIHRRGYRFIAPVSEVMVDAPAESEMPSSNLEKGTLSAQLRRKPRWPLLAVALTAMLIVTGIVYLVRSSSARRTPRGRVMLVVLPFQNLSNDPSQEYFSDGLTEETITDLGQLSPDQLGVIARTSAMAYKHTSKTVSEIGGELGVSYVLEGSIRREKGKARVSAQLIRVSDQTHLWAKNYDSDLNDMLQIEAQLGKDIASQVQVNLTPGPEVNVARTRPVDPEAYDLYLKARFYLDQRNPAAIKKSIDQFSRAISKDPNFAPAYAGLAFAYNLSNVLELYSPQESLPKAKAAAIKALEIDASLAEAHAALGMEKSHYDFDFPGAEKEFLEAVRLNPNSANAHLLYSNCYLMPMGRVSQAIAENQKALELDPLSLPINNFMAMTYMFAEDYEKANKQFQRTIAMDPTFPLAHQYYAYFLETTGKYEESIKENERSEVLFGSSPEQASANANAMLQAFKHGGEQAFRQRNLELTLNRLRRPNDGVVSASEVAGAYAFAGDRDKAFEWLDKAFDERDGQDITLLTVDPSWKQLRSDPRFGRFLSRMGLLD